MDFLYQGIPLGRFFGTRVTLAFSHIIMLLYLASGAQSLGPIGMAIVGLIFFISILLHEFGHVFACKAVGGQADQVILGPMGGLAAVQPPERPLPQFITTAGGPAVNGILLAICWGLLQIPAVERSLMDDTQLAFGLKIFLRGMVLINKMLLILNLLPIFPMDGGRIFQSILWPLAGYRNSMLITGMVGTVGGLGLLVVGTGIWPITIPLVEMDLGRESDSFLIIIGLTCALASWGLYQRSQEIPRARGG